MQQKEETRLDEHEYAEWWDVARKFKPEMTEAEFKEKWDAFQQEKKHREQEREQQ